MRNPLFPAVRSGADTPPNGDFAKYVDDLVALQARHLSGGQQMTQLNTTHARERTRAKPSQLAQTAPMPGSLGKPPARVSVQRSPGATAAPAKTSGQVGEATISELWETARSKLPTDALSVPGKFRIPPFWIYIGVILLIGASSYFDFDGVWPFFILIWLFVLGRVARSVIKTVGNAAGKR